jgi:hypothetical protein
MEAQVPLGQQLMKIWSDAGLWTYADGLLPTLLLGAAAVLICCGLLAAIWGWLEHLMMTTGPVGWVIFGFLWLIITLTINILFVFLVALPLLKYITGNGK